MNARAASTSAVSAYDEVLYATHANSATHPDRLATIATLMGMDPAPVGCCHVLELGCGSANNLIPSAAALPQSRFVGCDLASQPIAAGRQLADRLGLVNLELIECDLRAVPEALGTFDYIVAHGVYSWVAPEVRDGMLALIARRLAPHGVAFVSYNTYPGCYVRRMAWEILKFHTEEVSESRTRLAEARALIELVADPDNRERPANAALRQELRELAGRSDGALFHDDLAPVNDPSYFHEFAAQARGHGLDYLGDAEFTTMAEADVAPRVCAVLAGMDPLAREQYLDFIRGRRFRQTLLCHAGAAPNRAIAPDRLAGLWVLAPKLASEQGLLFPTAAPATDAAAALPAELEDVQAVVRTIALAWPRPIAVADLAHGFNADVPMPETVPRRLAEILVAAYGSGAIELHAYVPQYASLPGEHPVANPVARALIATGSRVTNAWHENIDLDDPIARKLVALLDGTRDRAALRTALGPSLTAESGETPAAMLERYLLHLARLALLVR